LLVNAQADAKRGGVAEVLKSTASRRSAPATNTNTHGDCSFCPLAGVNIVEAESSECALNLAVRDSKQSPAVLVTFHSSPLRLLQYPNRRGSLCHRSIAYASPQSRNSDKTRSALERLPGSARRQRVQFLRAQLLGLHRRSWQPFNKKHDSHAINCTDTECDPGDSKTFIWC
jgi:hypothetical protein